MDDPKVTAEIQKRSEGRITEKLSTLAKARHQSQPMGININEVLERGLKDNEEEDKI